MSHPTTRVLAMLELLQARHRLSGADLAGQLGVDQRTVRRYAGRLVDRGSRSPPSGGATAGTG